MEKPELIEHLIAKAFRKLDEWSEPEFIASPCPQTKVPFDEFRDGVNLRKETLREYLESSRDDVLQALENMSYAATELLNTPEFRGALQIYVDASDIQPPPWWAGGFGVSGYEPDYKYWAQMPSWSSSQCVALSAGVEPYVWDDVLSNPESFHEIPRFFMARRLNLLDATFSDQSDAKVTPTQFCDWGV